MKTRLHKTTITLLMLAITLFLVTSPAAGQWLHYRNQQIPRTADGKPNLNAPAPKAADGKPDLSGIWDIEHNRPCPKDGCPDMPVGQEFFNIGWSLKGGLPYQPWAAELVKERMASAGKDDPIRRCTPLGIIGNSTLPLMRKIVQLPRMVIILNEQNNSFRQIFADGRPLPDVDQPSIDGYSIGKWEGETFVVQTIGFIDGLWLDRNGSPLTDEAKVTERFRRVNYGKLEIEITVDDPKAYTAPWTVKLNHSLLPDTELLAYNCVENEKDAYPSTGK
jgi:hypothetical protein